MTPLLDDFDRADEGPPPGENWSNFYAAGYWPLRVIDNALSPDPDRQPPSHGEAYWSAAQFGPDCEAFITLRAMGEVPTAGGEWDHEFYTIFYLRMTSPYASRIDHNGYMVYFSFYSDGAGGRKAAIFFIRSESVGEYSITQHDIGDAYPEGFVLADGDAIGARVEGDVISAWHKPAGGVWAEVARVTDANITGAGYVGIKTENVDNPTDVRLDDFGAGTLVDAEFGELAVQPIKRGGVEPDWQALTPCGSYFKNDPERRTLLAVRNEGAVPVTITIAATASRDSLPVDDLVVVVPAGQERFIGHFPAHVYNQADGTIHVTANQVSGVYAAALEVHKWLIV